jgi:hypothetical protein
MWPGEGITSISYPREMRMSTAESNNFFFVYSGSTIAVSGTAALKCLFPQEKGTLCEITKSK